MAEIKLGGFLDADVSNFADPEFKQVIDTIRSQFLADPYAEIKSEYTLDYIGSEVLLDFEFKRITKSTEPKEWIRHKLTLHFCIHMKISLNFDDMFIICINIREFDAIKAFIESNDNCIVIEHSDRFVKYMNVISKKEYLYTANITIHENNVPNIQKYQFMKEIKILDKHLMLTLARRSQYNDIVDVIETKLYYNILDLKYFLHHAVINENKKLIGYFQSNYPRCYKAYSDDCVNTCIKQNKIDMVDFFLHKDSNITTDSLNIILKHVSSKSIKVNSEDILLKLVKVNNVHVERIFLKAFDRSLSGVCIFLAETMDHPPVSILARSLIEGCTHIYDIVKTKKCVGFVTLDHKIVRQENFHTLRNMGYDITNIVCDYHPKYYPEEFYAKYRIDKFDDIEYIYNFIKNALPNQFINLHYHYPKYLHNCAKIALNAKRYDLLWEIVKHKIYLNWSNSRIQKTDAILANNIEFLDFLIFKTNHRYVFDKKDVKIATENKLDEVADYINLHVEAKRISYEECINHKLTSIYEIKKRLKHAPTIEDFLFCIQNYETANFIELYQIKDVADDIITHILNEIVKLDYLELFESLYPKFLRDSYILQNICKRNSKSKISQFYKKMVDKQIKDNTEMIFVTSNTKFTLFSDGCSLMKYTT